MGFAFLTQQSMSFLLRFVYRTICWQMFFQIGVLKNFTNFTKKHLRWNLILVKLETPTHVFSCERCYCKFSGTSFLIEHLQWSLLNLSSRHMLCELNVYTMQRLRHRHFPVNFVKYLKTFLTTSDDCFYLSQDPKHQNTIWQIHPMSM